MCAYKLKLIILTFKYPSTLSVLQFYKCLSFQHPLLAKKMERKYFILINQIPW